MSDKQKIFDPLFPGYEFTEFILAGETPIIKDHRYDWWINRPSGMDGWIINITLDGIGQVWEDHNKFLVKKGDVLLFPNNVPHLYGRYKDSEKWTHRWIFFHPLPHWNNILKFKECVSGVYFTKISDTEIFEYVSNLFEEVIYLSYVNKENTTYQQLLLNLLEQVLLRSFQQDQIHSLPTSSKLPCREFQKIMQWLSLNYNKSFTIEDLSKALNLSPRYITQNFKAYFGISVMKWVNIQRLGIGARLLLITDTSIKNIAEHVGFSDALYFSRMFKKTYDMSPKEYRDLYFYQ
ncbi:MAG: arabinose operon transcriptional regulator AraC [Brevinema sp.]